jgi:hypothetical protein
VALPTVAAAPLPTPMEAAAPATKTNGKHFPFAS